MKRMILKWTVVAQLSVIISGACAQGVAVNTSGNPADPSAALDVSSTTQGVLVPRMTEVEKEAIAMPANGLLVYQTDGSSPGFWYYDGSQWVQAIGAQGPAGPQGPAGVSAGSNPITHVSEVSATRISWLQCYNNCFNLSAVPASPADGITYSDWRMPTAAEANYYKNTFSPPAAGWLNSSHPNYVWTTDLHITSSDISGWITMNETGTWNGNSTNTSMYCRCVR